MKWTMLALVLALTGCERLGAPQRVLLKVGDRAPQFSAGKFVQGEPLTSLTPGRAYIIEFWATWCAPCIDAIPRLSELHQTYEKEGLVVIGQECCVDEAPVAAARGEARGGAPLRPMPVDEFVRQMRERMTYRVVAARDSIEVTWLGASGNSSIPTLFLVDRKGLIAWIGHPLDLKTRLLEEVIAGTFDTKRAAFETENRNRNLAVALRIAGEVEKDLRRKRWEPAEQKLAEMERYLAADDKGKAERMRFELEVARKDFPKAYAAAQKVAEKSVEDANLQNELAWKIVTEPLLEQRDLALAERLALQAVEASGGKSAAILDTLARVYFMRGKKSEAILVQERAVELEEMGQQKAELRRVLESYRRGELPNVD